MVKVQLPFLVAVLASVALAFGTPTSWAMAAGTGFALWIAAGVVLGVRDRLRHRHGASVRRALGFGFTMRRQGLSCGVPVLLQEPAPQNLWRRVADAGRVSM